METVPIDMVIALLLKLKTYDYTHVSVGFNDRFTDIHVPIERIWLNHVLTVMVEEGEHVGA